MTGFVWLLNRNMLLLYINLIQCYYSIPTYRLLQYTQNSSNNNMIGSTRVSIDHQIGDYKTKPDSKKAVFMSIKNVNLTKVEELINVSSPIIFVVDDFKTDTKELEDFLLSKQQKAPIYFVIGDQVNDKMGTEFEYVKTTEMKSNSQFHKTKLQNIVGAINGSKTFGQEKVVIITAPFDSFSTVPGMNIGANNNGISIAALLEIMRQVSKFPIVNNWVFLFALVDGHFCKEEGLEKLLTTYSSIHSSKIKFAISLESIVAEKLHGVFGQRLRRESAFAKFMYCLLNAMRTANIDIETGLNEDGEKEGLTQATYNKHLINSITIVGEQDDQISRITDVEPNVTRANDIAWCISEALLRMMYNADNTATMINRQSVDTSKWATVISKVQRMSAFRDQTFAQSILQWMKKFATISSINEWSSNKCLAPYSSTQAKLIFYNNVPFIQLFGYFILALGYGAIILFIVGKYTGLSFKK